MPVFRHSLEMRTSGPSPLVAQIWICLAKGEISVRVSEYSFLVLPFDFFSLSSLILVLLVKIVSISTLTSKHSWFWLCQRFKEPSAKI